MLSDVMRDQLKRNTEREFIAGIILGEYRFSGVRYVKETRRTYWFNKYGVTIGIPKKMLNDMLSEQLNNTNNHEESGEE